MNRTILFSALIAASLPLAALAADLGGEIATAAQHAELASKASDIAGVHMHLHHTLNCLAGPKGAGYDSKELNPCASSGNGAIPDAAGNAAKVKALDDAAAKAQSGIAATDTKTAQKIAADTAAMLKAIH
jgi:hypothetical protein